MLRLGMGDGTPFVEIGLVNGVNGVKLLIGEEFQALGREARWMLFILFYFLF